MTDRRPLIASTFDPLGFVWRKKKRDQQFFELNDQQSRQRAYSQSTLLKP